MQPRQLEGFVELRLYIFISDEHQQGIAVDQEEEFLFAAGQDCRIRAWSLRTGLSLSQAKHTETLMNPFKSIFPSPISALQVTRDLGSNGISLWAAYDHDLSQFCLGQREL